MNEPLPDDPSIVETHSIFVRKRNALLVRADFAPLYIDYYLHLLQHSLSPEKTLDSMLKEALAAVTLHLCSRPQDEICAWTLHFEEMKMNLFVTGSTRPGRVTGRIFTEEVRSMDKNMFIAQITRPNQDSRQSMVDFEGFDVLRAAEQFYLQSEQRLTRFFRGEDDEMILIAAQPDCDLAWLEGLTDEDIPLLAEQETLSPLEKRSYIFECGCAPERLYPLLQRLPAEDLAFIFEDGVATVNCPRCAAVYNTPKAVFEEWLKQQAGNDESLDH